MARLCALLLWIALESAVKLALEPLVRLWLAVRPLRKLRQWRTRKRMASWAEHHLDEVAEPFNTETGMKSWLQSRTIQGLAASGVAWALAFLVGDAEAVTLNEQVTRWLLEGAQIGGLLYAARGRKLAQGPL